MKSIKFLYLLAFGLFIFASCNDDPVIENQEEVITDLVVTLTPTDGGDSKTLIFNDDDGDGGNAPSIVGTSLAPNTTYDAVIVVSGFEEGEDEKEDITIEILAEADEHQFFFQATGLSIDFEYADTDSANRPIGQQFRLITREAGSGTVLVTLLHEPTKDAAGVADGDITNAAGETDVAVTFPVTVE